MFRGTVKNPLGRIVKGSCIPAEKRGGKGGVPGGFFEPDEGLASGAPLRRDNARPIPCRGSAPAGGE
jgi:hypothetical protein